MKDMNVLDRPVWSALTTGWSHLAEGDGHAFRLNQDHGPFGATPNNFPESLDALAKLIPAGGELWLLQREGVVAPAGTAIKKAAPATQMVVERITSPAAGIAYEPLGEEDAAQMLELAQLTAPGPFAIMTHRLGRFIGIRWGSTLVAMAGERMSMPGFREVSGVCTHPDYRGRGYAQALTAVVTERILNEGDTPFLHAYASNLRAIALYERLGWRIRAPMITAVLTR